MTWIFQKTYFLLSYMVQFSVELSCENIIITEYCLCSWYFLKSSFFKNMKKTLKASINAVPMPRNLLRSYSLILMIVIHVSYFGTPLKKKFYETFLSFKVKVHMTSQEKVDEQFPVTIHLNFKILLALQQLLNKVGN